MGKSHSTAKETKEFFGDKTVEDFKKSFRETRQKSKKRRQEVTSETMKFKKTYAFANQEVFQKPMCLISTDEEGVFSIEEDTLRQIQQIDLPLVVVAVAGLYRTGKSYLMNRLAGHSKGFQLGGTVQSKTKGIWVWCRRHPKLVDTVLVLLDTEGLGDVAKGSITFDNKICTLAVLLSNVLVYNIMHTFNQDAVEKLTFVTEMSKTISFKNKMSDENASDQRLELILPTFVLCVRDFSLKLKREDGRDISANEYLQDCLESKPGEENEKYNKPRECIKKYFPKRACFTFDRPGERDILQKLDELQISDLSDDFRRDTETFLEYVYRCLPKQLLCSKPVTGKMFAVLTKSYVDAIRNGDIPDVDNAFQAVANLENEKLEQEAVESFQKGLEEMELPVPNMDELDNLRLELVGESLRQFRQQAVFNPKKFEDRALDKMESLWQKVKERNQDLLTKYCQKVFYEVYDAVLAKRIKKKKYHKPGGYEKYQNDLQEAKEMFYTKVKDIDEVIVKNVICSLLEDQKDIENEIMAYDKQLIEEEKAKEKQRMEKEIENAKEELRKKLKSVEEAEERRKQEYTKDLEALRREYDKRENERMERLENEIRKRDEGVFISFKLRNPFR